MESTTEQANGTEADPQTLMVDLTEEPAGGSHALPVAHAHWPHATVVGNGLMGGLLGHRKVGHFRVHI